MKNRGTRGNHQANHSGLAVTAISFEEEITRNMVEKLAGRFDDMSYCRMQLQPGAEPVESSSVEAYLSGQVWLSTKFLPATMGFDACFLFTCIRKNKPNYNLTWAISLS